MSHLKHENAAALVADLNLNSHVEGGFYRETYRAEEEVDTPRGKRNKETSIYYCLPSTDFSVWHRLVDLTETFHFHYGQPAIIYIIHDRKITKEILAKDPDGKEEIIIPPNVWFAIRPAGTDIPTDYSLMSCHVTPGFDFADLEIAGEELLEDLDTEFHKQALSLLKNVHPNTKR